MNPNQVQFEQYWRKTIAADIASLWLDLRCGYEMDSDISPDQLLRAIYDLVKTGKTVD